MKYAVDIRGQSAAFGADDAFLAGAVDAAEADVLVVLGASLRADPGRKAILVELGHECLAVYTNNSPDFANAVGFSRWCNAPDDASRLIELVRGDVTSPEALDAAAAVFTGAGFTIAVSADRAGRILDRIIRPVYNAALTLVDEGLATQADLDLTCRLGLGYPEGPVERVHRGGLLRHFQVSQNLFQATGNPAYVPARLAVVAARRKEAAQ